MLCGRGFLFVAVGMDVPADEIVLTKLLCNFRA